MGVFVCVYVCVRATYCYDTIFSGNVSFCSPLLFLMLQIIVLDFGFYLRFFSFLQWSCVLQLVPKLFKMCLSQFWDIKRLREFTAKRLCILSDLLRVISTPSSLSLQSCHQLRFLPVFYCSTFWFNNNTSIRLDDLLRSTVVSLNVGAKDSQLWGAGWGE